MADFNKPATTDTYANFLSYLNAKIADLALYLDPANTTATNVPTNAVRWNSANNRFEKYNGTAWGVLSSTYAFTNITGTGTLSINSGALLFDGTNLTVTNGTVIVDGTGGITAKNGNPITFYNSGNTAYGVMGFTSATGIYANSAFSVYGGNNLYLWNSINTSKASIYFTGTNVSFDKPVQIGAGQALRLYRSDNATYGDIAYGGAGVGIKFTDANSDGFRFFNGSTQVLALDSSGQLFLPNGNIYGKSDNTGAMSLYGGGAYNSGAGITLAGQSNSSANVIIFTRGAYVESARFDASGNLVIGDTTADTKLNLVGGALRVSGTRTAGSFLDISGNNTGINGVTLGVSYYGSGSYGPLKFATGGSTAMTLDASGNLLMNTPSSGWTTSGRTVLHVAGTTTSLIGVGNTSSNGAFLYSDNANATLGNNGSGYLVLNNNGVERARISGTVLYVGNSTTSGNVTGVGVQPDNVIIAHSTTIGATGFYSTFLYNGATVGRIEGDGGAGVLYTKTSDHRLKLNQRPITGALQRMMQLVPKEWDWENTGVHSAGYIAHEAQAVRPEAVKGEKDAVDADGKPIYQSMDNSMLVADVHAALRELTTKLLEAGVITIH